MSDQFQERYLAHQQRKKEVLQNILAERHSIRVFSDKEMTQDVLDELLHVVPLCPSSCDRKAISYRVITSRDEKALLGGLLVGGVGWIHRAPAVILLFADWDAYKEQLSYMPYLDAGVVIANIYLKATAMGLKGCYVNPQVRNENISFFRERFCNKESLIYCGAFGVGYGRL